MEPTLGKGVLIILTGGNVCLLATKDERRKATVLKPASIEDFQRTIIGSPGAEHILLREKSIQGIRQKIAFYDLRKDANKKNVDPEELDSAQVEPQLWSDIADIINSKYMDYEGFIILHGLDTLAYTASGLAFMLGKLQFPVIITGSQRPLNYMRTDAVQNIRSAITLASAEALGLEIPIPEVTVFLFDSLYRASRSTMVHASSYRAFDSPNYPVLAKFGEHIEFLATEKREIHRTRQIYLRKDVEAKVSIIDVFPGMNPGVLEHLTEGEFRGVLLRTYGMGTAPTSTEFMDALRKVVEAGVTVMNVTQAGGGRISYGQDPVSLRLFEQGVISGVDMTAEAAYAKMVVHMSQKKVPKNEKKRIEEREILEDHLQLDHAGEQTQSIFHFHFVAGETEPAEDSGYRAIPSKTRPMVERSLLTNNLKRVTYIQLRMLGVEPADRTDKPVHRSTDIDVDLVNKYQGRYKIVHPLRKDVLRWFPTGKRTINIAYDITDSLEYLLNPDTLIRIETLEPIRWKRLTIAVFANVSLVGS